MAGCFGASGDVIYHAGCEGLAGCLGRGDPGSDDPAVVAHRRLRGPATCHIPTHRTVVGPINPADPRLVVLAGGPSPRRRTNGRGRTRLPCGRLRHGSGQPRRLCQLAGRIIGRYGRPPP
eukprot:scaffold60297_cov36-Prasinocladus_malaysianus.AAC.1